MTTAEASLQRTLDHVDPLRDVHEPARVAHTHVRRRPHPPRSAGRRPDPVRELPHSRQPLGAPARQRLPRRARRRAHPRHRHRRHRPLGRLRDGLHRHPVREPALAGAAGGRGRPDHAPRRRRDRPAHRRARAVLQRAAVHRLARGTVPRARTRVRREPLVDPCRGPGGPVAPAHAVHRRRVVHHADRASSPCSSSRSEPSSCSGPASAGPSTRSAAASSRRASWA